MKYQRNPLSFPLESLKKIIQNLRVSNDNPKLTLELGDYVHPSLSLVADKVEYFVHRFRYALEAILVRIISFLRKKIFALNNEIPIV